MKCLLIHNRKTWGPKESSWFTFHHISEELKRRGHLFASYSIDYGLTNDNEKTLTDDEWLKADFIFTVFRNGIAPLKIAKKRRIPSILEINYACEEVATSFMIKELERLNLERDEIMYEHHNISRQLCKTATAVIGAGNTSYTEKTYRDCGIERVRFFKAGIDLDHFKPDLVARTNNEKIRFTFTAASLAFRKGIIHTCRAWRSLPSEYHDRIELHFFGRNPYGKQSLKEFDELKRDFKNVIHHSFISNQSPEYVREHAISHIMLCPTMAEGQSGTALEGMSFGLYPIVSPFTGLDYDMVPSTVLSPNPSEWIDELIKAIMSVVDNFKSVRNHFEALRKYAINNYQWSDFARNSVDYLEEIYKNYHEK